MKVVGLFRELDREMSPSLESIHDLRGRLSPDAASLVTEYLQRGTPIFDVMGVSADPLDERFIFSGGPSLVSDGLWVWRSDLHYFVDKYHMQLPEEFIRHVIAAGGTPVDMSGEIARIGEDVITAYDRAAKGL